MSGYHEALLMNLASSMDVESLDAMADVATQLFAVALENRLRNETTDEYLAWDNAFDGRTHSLIPLSMEVPVGIPGNMVSVQLTLNEASQRSFALLRERTMENGSYRSEEEYQYLFWLKAIDTLDRACANCQDSRLIRRRLRMEDDGHIEDIREEVATDILPELLRPKKHEDNPAHHS